MLDNIRVTGIYNDHNRLLVNLFGCVLDSPDELKDSVRYALNSCEDFNWIKKLLAAIPEYVVSKDTPPDVRYVFGLYGQWKGGKNLLPQSFLTA